MRCGGGEGSKGSGHWSPKNTSSAGCFALAWLVLCRRGTVGWCCVLSCGVCFLVSAEVYGMTFPTWSEEFLTVLCSCGGDGCFSCFLIVLCVSHLSQLVSCRGIPPCCQWRDLRQRGFGRHLDLYGRNWSTSRVLGAGPEQASGYHEEGRCVRELFKCI